ncbi:tyrosine-type recombinase/integrase [Lysobacter rhizosphaerae]
MARSVNKLSNLRIKALKEPGRYSDGDGLYFYVSRAGNRSWVFRYRDRVTGKLRDRGLGPARDVTLEQARAAARLARGELRSGVDPIDTRRAQRLETARQRLQAVTFGQCTDRYIETHRAAWRNAKHAGQWRATLDTYAAALLPRPVAEIDDADVLQALEPIWASKTETATRLRQRIEAVLDWAAARQYRRGDNPARWRGHLDHLLPTPSKLKPHQPRAALPYADTPDFFQMLQEEAGMAPIALQLQILTATRPGEVVGARWEEFDMDNLTWTIPGERMKAGKAHRIPLSPQVVKLLEAVPHAAELVFPGRLDKGMTTAALLKVLKTLRPGLTVHGFRSTFRDWAADMTAYPREVAEQALAHSLQDKTEAAYRRTDLFAKRALLMRDWARYCASPRSANASLSPIRASRRSR